MGLMSFHVLFNRKQGSKTKLFNYLHFLKFSKGIFEQARVFYNWEKNNPVSLTKSFESQKIFLLFISIFVSSDHFFFYWDTKA